MEGKRRMGLVLPLQLICSHFSLLSSELSTEELFSNAALYLLSYFPYFPVLAWLKLASERRSCLHCWHVRSSLFIVHVCFCRKVQKLFIQSVFYAKYSNYSFRWKKCDLGRKSIFEQEKHQKLPFDWSNQSGFSLLRCCKRKFKYLQTHSKSYWKLVLWVDQCSQSSYIKYDNFMSRWCNTTEDKAVYIFWEGLEGVWGRQGTVVCRVLRIEPFWDKRHFSEMPREDNLW